MSYEKPTVVDYGDLQEITASCAVSSGGDEASKLHIVSPFDVSKTNSIGCTSP